MAQGELPNSGHMQPTCQGKLRIGASRASDHSDQDRGGIVRVSGDHTLVRCAGTARTPAAGGSGALTQPPAYWDMGPPRSYTGGRLEPVSSTCNLWLPVSSRRDPAQLRGIAQLRPFRCMYSRAGHSTTIHSPHANWQSG